MIRWEALNEQIVACERCPRLRAHCANVATEKRRAFVNQGYWGRPVANFGDPKARLLIVGLAPAAHGANRTGRMFTGDRSGEWLYRALYKQGFSNRPDSVDRRDDLALINCAITAVCHCAPPDNKPTSEEQANCRDWLHSTFELVPARVIVALGQIAWKALLDESRRLGWLTGKSAKFAHLAELALAGDRTLLASYHPSQQNTFTGRLTEPMLDAVFLRAKRLLSEPVGKP